MTNTSTYGFMYALEPGSSLGNAVEYDLIDAGGGPAGVNPSAVNISVADPNGPVSLGDTITLTISSGHTGLTGDYRVISAADNPIDGIDGVIVQSLAHPHNYYFLSNVPYDGPDKVFSTQIETDPGQPVQPVCLMAGTMVLCPEGHKLVENLKRGNLVLTSDGRSVPVWLDRSPDRVEIVCRPRCASSQFA